MYEISGKYILVWIQDGISALCVSNIINEVLNVAPLLLINRSVQSSADLKLVHVLERLITSDDSLLLHTFPSKWQANGVHALADEVIDICVGGILVRRTELTGNLA